MLKDITSQFLGFQQTHHFRKATDEAYNRKLSLAPRDAMGGGNFLEEAYDDPCNNFFRLLQQSLGLPLPSPGFHFPSLFSAHRLLDVISRCFPPPDLPLPGLRKDQSLVQVWVGG
ncbi:uncharacterized protein F5891DRAFT_1182973 [Suillus fuscotomentosus]|uniref:Uncharacterized protein n=1 Tax=Suillus fuscotomentosus TaxID=1912939 RepID=A0AAD4HRA6_9AGAM|nr:uncharacterized protein F5891DRAFT_1182973 [Suillus fuscotomentosus]KAG1905907.1 hypothetical protein F5891DRAFT_1182973 [Suillus fuscotomentosus]